MAAELAYTIDPRGQLYTFLPPLVVFDFLAVKPPSAFYRQVSNQLWRVGLFDPATIVFDTKSNTATHCMCI